MKTPWFPNSSAPYTHWGGGVVFKFTKASPTQDLLADTPQGPEAPAALAPQCKAGESGSRRPVLGEAAERGEPPRPGLATRALHFS